MAAVPPFQRATFGETKEEQRRAFLEKVVVPDALLSAAGEADGVGRRPPVAYRIERALSNATLRVVRDHVGAAAAISAEDVRKYYDENRARYDTPERTQVWRILCPTRDVAASVLEQALKDPTPKTFAALARDYSLDKATNLRSGNLGFLTADGASNEPGLRVDPAIVRAARAVQDGELVKTPVPEGGNFAVVWRRGTIAARTHTIDDAAAQIRDTLWKARVKRETEELVSRLRREKLRDLDESPLDTVELPVDLEAGTMASRPR
jgi:peptidyl-prolyl cis-trans isomerase C